jgi:predicted house-cleaning noncanonical NTP pyrophosphatase (MazG superfamily)
MGWKLVRDHNEKWCRANGVSGQWRTAPDPPSALLKKIFEEGGEYAEHRDAAELYDLLDVVQALIGLEDPGGVLAAAHRVKVAEMGGFEKFVEWTPVPSAVTRELTGEEPVMDMGYLSLPAEVQAEIEGKRGDGH